MESRAFHICPFCQSPNPVSAPRCARCHRALAGLPLPVYGSDLDTGLARPDLALVDLPLRDPSTTAPLAPAAPPPSRAPAPARRATDRRRVGRGTTIAVATAAVGTALLGGWLVRAQEGARSQGGIAPEASAAPVTTTPAPVVGASSPAPTTAPAIARSRPAPRPVAASAPAATSAPVAISPVPTSRPAVTAAPVAPPRPRSSVRVWDIPPPAAPEEEREPSRPAERPRRADRDADVHTVHPDVRAAPAGVERARDTPASDPAYRQRLRAALDLAQERRTALARRVAVLRARTNVPVIKDVEDYQRVQDELASALDQLDAADAEVARLRRALAGAD
jgi:hypothetical protein